MKMTSLCSWIFVALPCLILLKLSSVEALLPCAQNWTGPSANNSIASCNVGPYLARTYGVQVLVPFVISVVCFLMITLAIIFRYCCRCCGSFRRRPGHCCCGGSEWDGVSEQRKNERYGSFSARCTKFSVFLVLIIAILALLLISVGVSRVNVNYVAIWNQTNATMAWAQTQVGLVISAVSEPSGGLVPGLSSNFTAAITAQAKSLENEVNNFKTKSVDIIWTPILITGYVIATVPIIFFIWSLICACCNIRVCGPLLAILFLSCIGYLFCILGATFSLVDFSMIEVCSEWQAQITGMPGVFQWLVLPTCQSAGVFNTTTQSLTSTLASAIHNTCTLATNFCDSNPNYDSVGGQNAYFYCPYSASIPTSCTSISTIQTQINVNTMPKPGTPTLCANVPNNQCTVQVCAQQCLSSSIKNNMQQVLNTMSAAQMLTNAVAAIAPLADCNNLINQGFSVLSQCTPIQLNASIIAGGSYVYALAAFLMCVLMFLGQKRFFNPSNVPGKGDQ